MGPNTWKSPLNNLKSATSVSSFKHYVKEYFLKKLSNVEADFYIKIGPKTKFATFLEFMENRKIIVLSFSLFQYQDSFQCLQSFLCLIFSLLIFQYILFRKGLQWK